jgi:ribonuclease P protein component
MSVQVSSCELHWCHFSGRPAVPSEPPLRRLPRRDRGFARSCSWVGTPLRFQIGAFPCRSMRVPGHRSARTEAHLDQRERPKRSSSVDPFGVLRGVGGLVRGRPTTDLRRPPREAHLPAQQPPPGPPARIPASHVRSRRPRRAEGTTSQGPEQAVGLIGRISDRSTFVALRRDGRRFRSGPIWIRVLPDDPADPPRPPRLACAFGRRTGRAVTRNLLRRRVRGAFEARAQADPGSIPPGAYLVGGADEVADLPFASLARHLDLCLDKVVGR